MYPLRTPGASLVFPPALLRFAPFAHVRKLLCHREMAGMQANFDTEDPFASHAVDVDAIALRHDPVELIKLLEYVLVAAVHCEDKMTYLQAIMDMGADHQAAMMYVINRMTSLLEGGGAGDELAPASPLSAPVHSPHTGSADPDSRLRHVGAPRRRDAGLLARGARV